MQGFNNSSKKVIQSTLHASLERDDALKMADQTVFDAILVLQD